ncbi:MAG: GNAT family N-acetyltransferase [Acidobacteriia bacterium]|nr:GNAT family N-acetyltransferase [Terriglobia bacterium]
MIRRLRESDLEAADRIFRIAFGTFLGLPDPSTFASDRDYVRTRWMAAPDAALAAEIDGALVGSNFATQWGSFGFFGPLTIKPELWNKGVAQQLLSPTVELFDSWRVRDAGLYTFSHSAKHAALYQKFGFWPRFLTALLSKPAAAERDESFLAFSTLPEARQEEAIEACRRLTDSIFGGLDVTREISAVEKQKLGDTVLVWDGDRLEAFAVCHCGAGTEAGKDNCYIKFAAADSEKSLRRLLASCESLAARRGLAKIEAGVNMARHEAYRAMLDSGFRTTMQGVAMQRSNSPGFNRPGVFILDDWR